jgi:hypothetical protein
MPLAGRHAPRSCAKPETGVKINPSVRMENLAEEERRLILESVQRLQGTDPAQWPKDQVVPLPHTQPWFLLRLPGDWRVIFECHESGEEELEIQHHFREGVLEWFRKELTNASKLQQNKLAKAEPEPKSNIAS